MFILRFIILLLFGVAVGFLGYRFFSSRGGKKLTARLPKEEKKKIFAHPVIKVISSFNERIIPSKWLRESIKRRLVSAGYLLNLEVNEFLLLKEICAILLPLLMKFMFGMKNPLLYLILIAVGFFLPDYWLKSVVDKRQKAIVLALPNVLDLLTLSVEAGLDYMAALDRIIAKSKPNPLIDELSQVSQEIKMGQTRKVALSAMSQRVNLPEIMSLTTVLIQTEEMGSPLGPALRNYAAQMRQKRSQRAEKLAGEAPVKMLAPLIIFIFPVIFIIIFTPIILQFMAMR